MSKIHIEIDLPEYCGDCPCGHYDETQSWCGLRDYYDKTNTIDGYCFDGKPEWCPLKKATIID